MPEKKNNLTLSMLKKLENASKIGYGVPNGAINYQARGVLSFKFGKLAAAICSSLDSNIRKLTSARQIF